MLARDDLKTALNLYKHVVTPELVESTLSSVSVAKEQRREGIFSTVVVVWLMIFQRLSPDHTLVSAIEHLKSEELEDLLLSQESTSIKVRHKRISNNTGGYSQGRQRVSLEAVEKITDALNEVLSETDKSLKSKKPTAKQKKIYAIDGTTILMSYSERNVDEYSQHKTRLGKSHYPLMRVTIATEMHSGVALKPAIGAHNGSKATSEIAQSHEVLAKIEKGSIILADRLYGVTQVVHKTEQLGLQIIVRVRESIAKRLTKKWDKQGDAEAIWLPSDFERKQHPQLVDANISGRYICKTINRPGFRPFKLYLFTTCDSDAYPTAEIIKLYGMRWNIEQDLRNLKTTLELNFVNAKSPDMVAKQLITGVTAYNFVRHFMKVAAKQLNISVRELSFKGVLRRLATLESITPTNRFIDTEKQNARLEKDLVTFLADIKILKLPSRKNPRSSQPRLKWRKGVQRFHDSVDSENIK